MTLNARGHGEYLAPALAACLADVGAAPGDLGAVVAGTGPGPFTGLRVGLVTAAVLGSTLGVPTYGVCSLDAIAGAVAPDGPLLVATDARRKEVYWARYLDGVRVAGPEVCGAADVPPGAAVAAGAGARLYADVLGLPLVGPDYPSATALVPGRGRPDPGRSAVRAAHAAVPAPARRRPARAAQGGDTVTPAAIAVVPMTAEHINALMAHEQAMFGTEAWSAASYRSELADTERRHYLAAVTESGDLLGWGGVMVVADSAEILTVGVVPTARRRGIARLLLDDLLAEARRRGAVEAFLEVRTDNDAARALYLREGFAEVGLRRGYYDGGRVDAVVMRRDL